MATTSALPVKRYRTAASAVLRWIGLPLFASVAWKIMDANPSLYLYDAFFASPAHKLQNSTVWITGASSGIGAAVTCRFFQFHATHVVLSSRSMEKIHRIVDECRATYPESPTTWSIIPYNALETNEDAINKYVQLAISSTPNKSIDILFLCAGICQIEPALVVTSKRRQEIIQVNFHAPVDLSSALIRTGRWKESGKGQLVVVASAMAKGPSSFASTYAASKAALRNYFQTLSTEEWSWLKVTVLLPGGTSTKMWENTGTTVRPDRGALMEPARVAQLMVSAMTGPVWLFYEAWITKSTGLLYIFMSHYTPTLFYIINHYVGLVRRTALEGGGKDMLELSSIIQSLLRIPFAG